MSSWRAPRKKVRLDLTSMVDVVFVLLLFLVVVSRFDQQSALPVGLPQDSRPSPLTRDPLLVTVTATAVAVGGQFVDDAGPEAAKQLARNPGSAVVLQADASVPYARVFGVLSSLSKSGIADVGLAYDVRP